jgi:hypothetical protein
MSQAFEMPILGERDQRGKRIVPARIFSFSVTPEYRRQAEVNHGQTLERLRTRGGLSWREIRWMLTGRKWNSDSVREEAAMAECLDLFPQVWESK